MGIDELTKEGLTAYFRDFLGGDRGEASAEVLADVVLCAVYRETEPLKAELGAAIGLAASRDRWERRARLLLRGYKEKSTEAAELLVRNLYLEALSYGVKFQPE